MVTNPHNVLGVPPSASKDEVKAAYRRLCLRYHPDMCPPHLKEKAGHLFRQISEAYTAMMSGARQPPPHYSSTNTGGSHWSPPRARVRFSNRIVAMLISLPVILTGIRIGMAYSDLTRESGRIHGLINPPVNPFLRQDQHGQMRVRWARNQQNEPQQ